MARKKPKVRQITSRIRVVMAVRGVKSITELSRRLSDVDVEISVPQLGRLVDGKTKQINREILAGLITVLDCSVGDLFAEE